MAPFRVTLLTFHLLLTVLLLTRQLHLIYLTFTFCFVLEFFFPVSLELMATYYVGKSLHEEKVRGDWIWHGSSSK